MKINTTTVTQSANELLGTPAKTLFYLVIENAKGSKMTINVGEKTHKQVQELLKEEGPQAQLNLK